MTSIGIEDMIYEPVPLIGWKPFHRLQELGVFGPANGLHPHRVVAVWVVDGSRRIGNIAGQPVRDKQNGSRQIMRQTVSKPPKRLHFSD